MRPPSGGQELSGRTMIFILIGINIFLYLIFPAPRTMQQLVDPDFPYYRLVLSSRGIASGQIWQLVTAMFMHADFYHILFNMYGLYLFGMLLAPLMNGYKILWLYLIGGLSGNLIFLLFNWGNPFYLMGASGALFGIMAAVALLRPNVQFIMLLPPIPVKAKTLVIVYAVIELLFQFGNGGQSDGIAHLAHLGGLLGGYLYIKFLFGPNLAWDILPRRRVRPGETPPPGAGPRMWRQPDFTVKPGSKIKSQDIDYLLDKISKTGINSLTPEETEILRRAREQMRGKH